MTESKSSDPNNRFSHDASDSDPEEALWSGNFSGKDMTGAWISLAILTVALLIVMLLIPALRGNSLAWLGFLVVILVAWLGAVVKMFYHKLSLYYEVTSQRLKHRDGILVRSNNRIEMIDIDDVSYRQGPIQALLNVGDIIIRSSDTSHPELVMKGIADVRMVADLIDDARRAERRKRGLHIESI